MAGTGLLLVHGIGSQSRASVITPTCDALVTWLRHRYGDEAVTFGLTSLRLGEDASQGPPSTQLRFPDGNWVIAESRWAESFIAPSFERIMGWTLNSVLCAARLEAGYLLGPDWTTEPDDNGDLLAPARPYRTTRAFRYVKGLVVLAALPVTLVALTATSMLRLFPPLRDQVTRIQSLLSGTIGDSYVFVSGGAGRAAIVQQVRRDIEWMRAQGVDRVVVAAHSQGAAVTFEALDQWECPLGDAEADACGCDQLTVELLTYGSGLDKLTALRDSTRRQTLSSLLAAAVGLVGTAAAAFSSLAVVEVITRGVDKPETLALTMVGVTALCVGLTAVAWYAALLRPLGLVKRGWTVGKYALLGGAPAVTFGVLVLTSPSLGPMGLVLTLVAAGLAKNLMVDARNDEILSVPAMASCWIDVRSTSDPVASSSTVSPTGRIDLVVHNLRSAVYDHTSYWDNWSEFLPIVINVMAGRGTSLGVPRFWTQQERSRRFEWTWVLAGNRAVFAVLSLSTVVWALTSLPGIGRWTANKYGALAGVLGDDVEPVTSTAVATLIGIGVVVLLFLVVYQALATSWHARQRYTAHKQVKQLQLLAAHRDQWPRWRAAVSCTRLGVSSSSTGWLVLTTDNGDDQLRWFEEESAECEGQELPESLRVQVSLGRPTIRVGDATFTTRSLRAASHLRRVYDHPTFR